MVVSENFCTFAKAKQNSLKELLYILGSYARYRITSWHTGGHHIHSPYLFYIARAILPETARYYCFGDIESAYSRIHKGKQLRPLKLRKEEQIACRLVNFQKSKTIVAASKGTGTLEAYLAMPSSQAQVLCLRNREPQAEELWKALAIHNIEVAGPSSATLPPEIDFAIIDLEMQHGILIFQTLMQHIGQKSIFAIQNIRSSKQAHLHWRTMQQQKQVTASMDLGNIGLLFFDTHFPKEEYRIRI